MGEGNNFSLSVHRKGGTPVQVLSQDGTPDPAGEVPQCQPGRGYLSASQGVPPDVFTHQKDSLPLTLQGNIDHATHLYHARPALAGWQGEKGR